MAYHLHWSFEQLVSLDHGERRRWVTEVARINQRLNQQSQRSQEIPLAEW